MRNSVISSLVTTVVAQVNDRLVAAGVAVRKLLTRTWCMREQCRGWQESHAAFSPHSQGFGIMHSAKHPWVALKEAGLKRAGLKRPGLIQAQQCAFAYCPAYAAAARFAPRG